jgi:putative nucleotidyltransferase with HDIG domain
MSANLAGLENGPWRFPHCPEPPDWRLDWPALLEDFPWLPALANCPQDAVYHGEGDVLTHTRMVCEALTLLPNWRRLPPEARSILFAAALLHDIGKPARTVIEESGRISSRDHARAGARLAHRILYTQEPFKAHPVPFAARTAIIGLVLLHGLPLYLLDRDDPRRAVITASQTVLCNWLAMLAEADVKGRICRDTADLADRVTLFAEFADEQNCLTAPYPFADGLSRFTYFHKVSGDPDYVPYDESRCEVVVLSGLPGSGKDTYVRAHLADRPVISLDALRAEYGAPSHGAQGEVIALAREQARLHLRAGQGFVWNATNISRRLRTPLIESFVAYGAQVRIVYLEAPYAVLLRRNRTRSAPLPDTALLKMAQSLEVPDPTEAHQLHIAAL